MMIKGCLSSNHHHRDSLLMRKFLKPTITSYADPLTILNSAAPVFLHGYLTWYQSHSFQQVMGSNLTPDPFSLSTYLFAHPLTMILASNRGMLTRKKRIQPRNAFFTPPDAYRTAAKCAFAGGGSHRRRVKFFFN